MMRARRVLTVTWICATLAFGCSDEEGAGAAAPVTPGSVSDASTAPPVDADGGLLPTGDDAAISGPSTTYTEHVRPILNDNCVACHAPGRIAPFSLETYEQAKTFAPLIAHVTRARIMPPSSIDNSGECNTFRDLPWLSEEEIATLERWSEQGAPEGDAGLPSPTAPALPALQGDVRTLTTPSYVPSTERADDYRCFVVESPFDQDTFVTGFNMLPGDLETAHHAVVFYPMDDGSAVLAQLLEASEEGPGYTCFGGTGVPATVIGAWAPGGGATRYPDDLGIAVAGGRPLIIQMHYNTAGTPQPGADQTTIELESRTEGVSPAIFSNLLDLEMSIPAGQTDAEALVEKAPRMPEASAGKPLQIYGVFPHMHELGKTLTLTTSGMPGGDMCLIDVPRYDFHWQRMYFFDTPLTLPAGQTMQVQCIYDTTSRTEPVTWGEGTQDEMCVAGLLIKL